MDLSQGTGKRNPVSGRAGGSDKWTFGLMIDDDGSLGDYPN
jgi:hypothetical protein